MFGAPETIAFTPIIIFHAAAASVSLLLGGVVLMMKKGTATHKLLGRVWSGLMGFVAISSFWIGTSFSYIHLLSIWVIFSLTIAFVAIRKMGGIRGRRIHAASMIGNYIGLWSAAIPAVMTDGRLINLLLLS